MKSYSKYFSILLVSAIFAALFVASGAYATTYYANYTVNPGDSASPQFVVQAIQYDPYPVSAGDSFDVWIKAQNIGTDDAKNVEFTLVPSYPFSSTDNLVRDFGIVSGTWNAHAAQSSLGDSSSEANMVLMKFRVQVAANAPVGENMLQIKGTPDKSSGTSVTYNIPIEVGKTKTDFDVVLQPSSASSSGLSLSIANTGANPATAVTVSLPKQESIEGQGYSNIIGNLASGDFTTVSFSTVPRPGASTLAVDISYTDSVGIRNTVEKNITLQGSSFQAMNFSSGGTRFSRTSQTSSSSPIPYIALGVLFGVLAMFIIHRRKK